MSSSWFDEVKYFFNKIIFHMHLLFYFPLNAWFSSVVVHMENTLYNHLCCSSTNEQKPMGGFLRKRGNKLPFRFVQLAFHLFCKEPTMTHTPKFQFNLCCLWFEISQCLFCLPGPIVQGWPVPFQSQYLHTLVNYPRVIFAQCPIVKAVHPLKLQQTSGMRIQFG